MNERKDLNSVYMVGNVTLRVKPKNKFFVKNNDKFFMVKVKNFSGISKIKENTRVGINGCLDGDSEGCFIQAHSIVIMEVK